MKNLIILLIISLFAIILGIYFFKINPPPNPEIQIANKHRSNPENHTSSDILPLNKKQGKAPKQNKTPEKTPSKKTIDTPNSSPQQLASLSEVVHPFIKPFEIEESTKSSIQGIILAYQQENYNLVITELKPRIPDLKGYKKDTYILLLATSYLLNNQPTFAIKHLEKTENVSKLILNDYQWYLALAYLANNQKEEGITLLNTISPNEFPDVNKLLLKIKSIK